MKKILLTILVAASLTGCVNTSVLTEEQRVEAIRRYPFNFSLNITPENGVAMTTTKIFGRIFVDVLTFGLMELALYEDRESTYNTYIKHDFRYNPLLNKEKYYLINVLGAPNRTFPDGLGGEIYIYEFDKIRGGGNQHGSYYYSQREIIEFYYNQSGLCYKWRRELK